MIPILTKSVLPPRDMHLFEAHRTIKHYRDQLTKLLQVDMALDKIHRMRLVNEHIRVTEWIRENEKQIMVEFVAY